MSLNHDFALSNWKVNLEKKCKNIEYSVPKIQHKLKFMRKGNPQSIVNT